ncbi:hypothetical protein AVEN_152170-1 [Araneus ventricosus]|uniref:RNase H type-1 domain-containing protein n=1 Tax=Araneus ventricosus TaxID=182803 RepID=A0A4Y2HKM9_ARAVE|nr:hypothetical protein AVEN_152170-1 [Araneus ventricosus]
MYQYLIEKGLNIAFYWIPGHAGISGNEEADQASKTVPLMLENFVPLGLEEGGGLIIAGESSKSSDMLYSKASSSDKEEELISASASDSRDCKIVFFNGGRTAIGRSSVSTKAKQFRENELCSPLQLTHFSERVQSVLSCPTSAQRAQENALDSEKRLTNHIRTVDLNGRGPYMFKVYGQIFHCIRRLQPIEGEAPQYSQLHMRDSTQEIEVRISHPANEDCLFHILAQLKKKFRQQNRLSSTY